MMYGYGFGGLMFLWMALFWIGVILLVVWAVRAWSPNAPRSSGRSRAVEILEERFARGEIDRDEFEQRRRDLTDH